jgi:hypothetical protein
MKSAATMESREMDLGGYRWQCWTFAYGRSRNVILTLQITRSDSEVILRDSSIHGVLI